MKRLGKSYWTTYSTRDGGCGHSHRSVEAADKCLAKFEKRMWRELRIGHTTREVWRVMPDGTWTRVVDTEDPWEDVSLFEALSMGADDDPSPGT
jgi:hypothetical protein